MLQSENLSAKRAAFIEKVETELSVSDFNQWLEDMKWRGNSYTRFKQFTKDMSEAELRHTARATGLSVPCLVSEFGLGMTSLPAPVIDSILETA